MQVFQKQMAFAQAASVVAMQQHGLLVMHTERSQKKQFFHDKMRFSRLQAKAHSWQCCKSTA
jgi:hypothetical protein